MAQPAPVILDLRNRSTCSPPASPSTSPSSLSDSASTSASSINDEDSSPTDPLREQVIKGLVGTQQAVLPGKTDDDRQFAYKRTIPTMTLYSEKGLNIYEDITNTKAYYPFAAEKEILETYGDEIACRMFGLPSSVLVGKNGKKEKFENDRRREDASASKEKWGDASVGLFNYGVNGAANKHQPSSVGLAVELGSGSLDKTRHLLRSMSKLLQPQEENATEGVMKSIDYKALDLEAASLRSTLSSLAEIEGDCVTTSLSPQDEASSLLNGKRRVSVSGLHATYDEGLAFLKAQSAQMNSSAMESLSLSPFSSPEASPERLPPVDEDLELPTSGSRRSSDAEAEAASGEQRKTSILWLGSSIGNFTREEAVEFLKGIELGEGDTMLIGVDGCAEGDKIVEAYNDPEGVTRAFILEGVDVAGRTLGEEAAEVLNQENFDYVNRWNVEVGRHEAYVRAKADLTIPLPEGDVTEVQLSKGELLQIEVSYKYLFPEALALFHLSGLRLIQHWTDSSNSHTLYLVEKPRMWFPSPCKSAAKMLGIEDSNPEKRDENIFGVPSLDEWEEMWKAWDGLMLETIPPSLRFTKPIPLRHVPLFYIGHIPAFRDIHLSRLLDEPLTSPSHFSDIFERGIDPNVDSGECAHWHSEVPQTETDWPQMSEIVEYERKVRHRVRDVYVKFEGKWTTRMARVLMMVLEHEQMHWETAVYICLQASTSLNAPPGMAIPDFPSLSRSSARALAALSPAQRNPVLSFDAQTINIGHDDLDSLDAQAAFDPQHEFGWDCENPQRTEKVSAFKLDTLPITNGEYLDWILSAKVGEEERAKLTPASWAIRGGFTQGGLAVKTMWGEVEMQYAREWPMAGSAEQLERFAKSTNSQNTLQDKGGRLPTYPETVLFNSLHPSESPLSNLGFSNLHPVPPTLPSKARDGSILPATDGGLWQWTSSVLDKWEGYQGSEVYPGYSEDFMDGLHRIVVGGSYASPRRIVRPTFVNYYQANYPYMLGGARVAYDVEA
ncbi:hypothetical protein JCM11641_007161 [Rhodosporidiobolus odoratus]